MCEGKSCGPQGSARLMRTLKEGFTVRQGSDEIVDLAFCDCLGHCEKGPNVKVDNVVLNGAKQETIVTRVKESKEGDRKEVEIDLEKILSSL